MLNHLGIGHALGQQPGSPKPLGHLLHLFAGAQVLQKGGAVLCIVDFYKDPVEVLNHFLVKRMLGHGGSSQSKFFQRAA